jgi:DNA-binding Lrp family transcriptional regulator
MDTVTRDVIRCLLWPRGDDRPYQRPTYWTVAKQLKASPAAVRTRLESLYGTGALKAIRIIPNPSYLDLDKTMVVAQVTEATCRRLKAKIELFDFLESTHHARTYYPEAGLSFASLAVLHAGSEDLRRKMRLVEEVVGDVRTIHEAGFRRAATKAELPTGAKQLLWELVKDPLIGMNELSENLGISRKTARKYLDLLVTKRAFAMEPEFDSSRMEGALPFVVAGFLEESSRVIVESEFRERLKDNYMLFRSDYEGLFLYACWADDFQDVRQCYSQILAVRGLVNPMVLFPFESVGNQSVRYT